MVCQIANRIIEITTDKKILEYLYELDEYTIDSKAVSRIDLRRFVFPKDRVPQHEQGFSGFQTRAGREEGEAERIGLAHDDAVIDLVSEDRKEIENS